MPYIISKSNYPSDKATEVVARYIESLSKYPLDENIGTEVLQGASRATKKGIEVMAIMKTKEGKFDEALTYTSKVLGMFYDIVGFECSVDVWLTIEEGFASLGMTMPE